MKNIKAKIQEILMNSSQKSIIGWAVEEDDFEYVADEIVKNCFIPNVSNRRELLIDCVRTCLKDEESVTVEQQVDTYLHNKGN